MIGMGAEASTIARAEAADFLLNCGAVKIPSDERVGDVPGSVHNHAQGLGLETFQDFISNKIEEAVVNLSTYYSDISLERLMKITHKPVAIACVSTEIQTQHLSNRAELLGQPTR
jgi:hypothetical protein